LYDPSASVDVTALTTGAVVSRLYDSDPETEALAKVFPAVSVTLAPAGTTVRPRVDVPLTP
jgi:hypothetical protein